MNWIKNAWAKVTSFLQYLGILGKAKTLVETFPGLDDQENLKQWVFASADNFQPVVDKTENKVDDRILFEIRRVTMNEKAFAAIYSLLVLAWEFVPRSGEEPLYGSAAQDAFQDFAKAVEDRETGNPLILISVAGLLLQVIMFIKSRREGQ